MGKSFDTEGRYEVTITEAFIREGIDNDDPSAFALVLKGETDDGYEGYHYLNYRDTRISGGKHAGKTVAEVSKETLASIGVPDGYIPAVQECITNGLRAQFTLKYDDYFNPPKIVVKWVNPVSNLTPIADVDLEALVARFENKTGAPVKTAGKPTRTTTQTPPPFDNSPVVDDDDMPF